MGAGVLFAVSSARAVMCVSVVVERVSFVLGACVVVGVGVSVVGAVSAGVAIGVTLAVGASAVLGVSTTAPMSSHRKLCSTATAHLARV